MSRHGGRWWSSALHGAAAPPVAGTDSGPPGRSTATASSVEIRRSRADNSATSASWRNTPGSEGGGPSPGGGPPRPIRRARTPRAGCVLRRDPRSPNTLTTRTVRDGGGNGEAALHIDRLTDPCTGTTASDPETARQPLYFFTSPCRPAILSTPGRQVRPRPTRTASWRHPDGPGQDHRLRRGRRCKRVASTR